MMFLLTCSIVILLHTSQSFEAKPLQSINVMISQTEPFAYFDAKQYSLKGLDVEIIKNFARKFNLKMNYFITNETLNEVFSSENRANDFLELRRNS